MMPLMMTTILDVFEPHERGKYMGVFGLVIGLAPALVPNQLLNQIRPCTSHVHEVQTHLISLSSLMAS